MTVNNVYPWGRSFDEYRRMFALTDADLDRRMLGCADGPAAFNAAMHRQGRRVVSCDPLYQFTPDEIRARIDATYAHMLDLVVREHQRFVWTTIPSPQHLGQIRMAAMNDFLTDGRHERLPHRLPIPRQPHPLHPRLPPRPPLPRRLLRPRPLLPLPLPLLE